MGGHKLCGPINFDFCLKDFTVLNDSDRGQAVAANSNTLGVRHKFDGADITATELAGNFGNDLACVGRLTGGLNFHGVTYMVS